MKISDIIKTEAAATGLLSKAVEFKPGLYSVHVYTKKQAFIRDSYKQELIGRLNAAIPPAYLASALRISGGGATEGNVMITLTPEGIANF